MRVKIEDSDSLIAYCRKRLNSVYNIPLLTQTLFQLQKVVKDYHEHGFVRVEINW